jgi:imidazolonepropionase-like amidohydrolase
MRTIYRSLAIGCALAMGMAAAQQQPATPAKKQSQPAKTAPESPKKVTPLTALRGGRVMTVSHGTIENGVVVMQNGRISVVGGPETSIPRGARVIDAKGMVVYPGLIDSETQLGLTEISAVDMTNDLVEPSDNIMPHMHVYDAFHAESELIPVTRINGVTHAVVAAGNRDSLPGQSALVQLAGPSSEEMILVRDLALPVNFNGRQRRNESFDRAKFPFTRMGVIAQLRQAFIDALDYQRKLDDCAKKPAESKPEAEAKDGEKKEGRGASGCPPKRDLKHEALLPYLGGAKPVVLSAEEPSDIKVALRLAEEFKLKVILNRVTYSQRMIDELAAAKLPVIISTFYEDPKDEDRYDVVFRLPAELQKRGVKIAFATSDAHNVRNLPYEAGYAAGWGMPYDAAMRAITLNPAEIWGVADQLGSLDVGKMANVVVANGDPLDVRTDVKHVFIAGEEVPLVSRQTELRDMYWPRPAAR